MKMYSKKNSDLGLFEQSSKLSKSQIALKKFRIINKNYQLQIQVFTFLNYSILKN